VLLGALGCVAIFALGTTAADRKVGLIAALILIANPLYRLHGARAMSDVPAEACLLSALALALWSWRRVLARGLDLRACLTAVGGGVFAGLAVLSKLNGVLAGLVMTAWAILALALPGFSLGRKLAVVGLLLPAGAAACGTFVGLNPFMTAQPASAPAEFGALPHLGVVGRFAWLIEHRLRVSADQQKIFPHNALTSPTDKIQAVAVQGFGRFGLFGPDQSDSRQRFDRAQDWGALLWLPIVALGLAWSCRRGRDQLRAGLPPTAWAVATYALLTLAIVTAFLPLAWDRYYLSLQSGSALLVAGAAGALVDRLARGSLRAGEG
jgi:4-amino-4-deoxy-L-arabinose transferase-like glycosyltransferase